jgi:hypothetical protein
MKTKNLTPLYLVFFLSFSAHAKAVHPIFKSSSFAINKDNSYLHQTDSNFRHVATIYKKVVPKKILNYIKSNLADWSFPSPDLWDAKTFEYYRSNKSLANFIAADFNGDGVEDYAMILTNSKKQFAVWIITSTSDGLSLTQWYTDNYKDKIKIALSIMRPGIYFEEIMDRPNSDPIQIKNNAIEVVNPDDVRYAIYWKSSKFTGFRIKN